MSDINIRTEIMNTGLDQISSLEQDIANAINTIDASNQVDLIKLQQMTAEYNNVISLMSGILKDLSDTDKEVIRNT